MPTADWQMATRKWQEESENEPNAEAQQNAKCFYFFFAFVRVPNVQTFHLATGRAVSGLKHISIHYE